jgi:hypothetical protein
MLASGAGRAGALLGAAEHRGLAPLVLVGSTNPVKVAAARAAAACLLPQAAAARLEVRGVPSASGVPEQPVGDDQTLAGALNRVEDMQRAHGGSGGGAAGARPPWLLVAIEGGVLWRPAASASVAASGGAPGARRELYCMAWVVAKCPRSGVRAEQGMAWALTCPGRGKRAAASRLGRALAACSLWGAAACGASRVRVLL